MFCPEGMAASISAAAVAIAKGKSAEELDLLASVFTKLGDTLATIASAHQFCEDSENDGNNVSVKYQNP